MLFFFRTKIAPANFNKAVFSERQSIQYIEFILFFKLNLQVPRKKTFVKSPQELVIILQFQTTCW